MKISMPMEGKTKTWVHTEETMRRQRERAAIREKAALSSLGIFGQITIGCSLYLYDHVSTPGYLSILLTLPFLLLIQGTGFMLMRRSDPGKGAILEGAGEIAGRILAALLALLCWLDGQLAFYALCAMVSNILPTVSSFQVALAIAVIVAFALGGQGNQGLARLSRLIGVLVFLCIFYCVLIALPYGNGGHLFPLLGRGMGSIFRGAFWMCGCLSGACLPLLMPLENKEAMTENRRLLWKPSLLALLGGCGIALLSGYLLPFYALARPETMGYRLLLLARISPSVAGWSLLVCAMLFLMLMTLGAAVQGGGKLLALSGRRRKIPVSLTAGILFSYVPCGALNIQPLEDIFLQLGFFRPVLLLAVLLILWMGVILKKRKKAPEQEAEA